MCTVTCATPKAMRSARPGAYYPSTAAAGGDTWFNNSKNYYDAPIQGNYGYLTILHETGHALGLKHPHEVSGAFGAMPLDHDSLEYSVMSYKSYVGGPSTGYTVAYGSYPQTLMMDDIAAIQKLYGANYSTNSGDTVYKWSPTTGETFINGVGQGAPAANKIFMTIWDGGGIDSYDFSNYSTSLQVNLQPGAWTTVSSTQLGDLGSGHFAAGNIANALLYNNNLASLIENVIGGSGNDFIIGNIANNIFTGNGGNDVLNGDAGTDTANYSGLFSDYLVVENLDGTWTITDLRGIDGSDTLTNFEFLHFIDTTLTIGTVPPPPPPPPPPPENDAPLALDDVYSTNKATKLTIGGTGVLANDGDPDGDLLSALLVTGPAHGKLTLNSDGSFSYTPNKNYAGTDSFTYKAVDALGAYDLATVTINVMGTNGPNKGKPGGGSDQFHIDGDQIPTPFPADGFIYQPPTQPLQIVINAADGGVLIYDGSAGRS